MLLGWLAGLLLLALGLLYYFRRIARYAGAFVLAQISLRRFIHNRQTTADAFASRVRATPNAIAIEFEERSITYSALDRQSNRVAQWGLSVGLKPRQTVALMMDNRPEFVAVWLGMAKIGIATALINTNLRSHSLAHCIRSCDAHLCIVGAECMEAFTSARGELRADMPVWVHTEQMSISAMGLPYGSAPVTPLGSPTAGPNGLSHSPTHDLSTALASYPDLLVDFSPHRVGLHSSDLLFLIFTSGTTGLPKAAKIKHLRWQMAGVSFVNFFGIEATDRIYNCLPLYHSAGGMIGFSCAWLTGATILLRRKFSARSFFTEAAAQRATIVQYIGQLCSYLLATPPSAADTGHSVRMALGNGLSADVWRAFQSRFAIPRVCEFYASTEGNANLVNCWNRPGVIGWIPPVAKLLYPVRIVRFDPLEERPVRDAHTGRCIEVRPGEVGELLSRIDADPLRHFDGYTDTRATHAKVLHNVFRTGDAFFRSGDLVRADGEGFIYFVDRVGDTYRWKGENVATIEVGSVLSAFQSRTSPRVSIAECNVYGVAVPGYEGRAGMAALVLGQNSGHHQQTGGAHALEAEFDFEGLYSYLQSRLPSYQSPLFLRIQPQLDTTSTFKHRKADLVKEGFDPRVITEPIYFRDDQMRRFVRMHPQMYDNIVAGQVRL